jgi:uncharacterized membrane protein
LSLSRKKQLDLVQENATSMEVGSPSGFWASLQGSSLSVIAIVAVIGVIVVAVSVIDLARYALEQGHHTGSTTLPSR